MRNQIFISLVLLLTAHCSLPTAHSQGMTTYPGALDSPSSLPVAVDNKIATLTEALNSTATAAEVNSTAGFPSAGIVVIDRERIAYTGTTPRSFTGLTRGFDGTIARPHSVNFQVRAVLLAVHVNGNRGAILELEKKVGAGAGDAAEAESGEVLTKLENGNTGWTPVASQGGGGGGLTDTQLRASPVPVSGPLTNTELRAASVPVSISSMPTTPVSGPLTESQLRASPIAVDNSAVTQPISASALPLPSGASTSAKQDTGNTSLSNIDSKLPAALVGGRVDVNVGNTPNVAVTNVPHVIVDTAPTTAVTGPLTDAQLRAAAVPISGTVTTTPPSTSWTCGLNALAATLTQCRAAPGAGLKLYVTDILVQTTTATTGTYSIQYGTGTNCATGPTALFPVSATSSRFNAPINSQPMAAFHFNTPLSAAENNAVCVIGVATNTISIQLSGYTAP